MGIYNFKNGAGETLGFSFLTEPVRPDGKIPAEFNPGSQGDAICKVITTRDPVGLENFRVALEQALRNEVQDHPKRKDPVWAMEYAKDLTSPGGDIYRYCVPADQIGALHDRDAGADLPYAKTDDHRWDSISRSSPRSAGIRLDLSQNSESGDSNVSLAELGRGYINAGLGDARFGNLGDTSDDEYGRLNRADLVGR